MTESLQPLPGGGHPPTGGTHTWTPPDPYPGQVGDPGRPQPVWATHGGPHPGWPAPPPTANPWPPAGHAPVARPRSALERGLAAAGAGAVAILKWGVVLLKFGKFGPTAISMAVSAVILAGIFGPAYGVGLLLLIAVHESGHVIAARLEGVPSSLPLFLGPLGALITIRAPMRDAQQEAVVGIGGPVLGTAGAAACALLAAASTGRTAELLIALAYIGFAINLFNLVPLRPLDGGRVTMALSTPYLVAGVLTMGGVIVAMFEGALGYGVNPILVVLFILGCITTWRRLRAHGDEPYMRSVAPGARALLGASYIALIVVCAVGMSAAHGALIDRAVIDGGGLLGR